MNNLYLIDVSPFVHAGSVNKYARFERTVENGSVWDTLVTPAGGISLIFNVLYNIVGRGDIIACCDRNPTIKKERIVGYKSNRHHKHEIEIGKQVAEYILDKCNISTIAYDGYEADDIIYTYVRRLYNQYDHIYIYTGDSDLYFLVDDKIEIMPSSSRAKHVTRENYESTPLHGQFYKYNTITLDKIVFGDKSDCIPPMPNSATEEIREILYSQSDYFENFGNKNYLLSVAEGHPALIEQIEKVFPLEIDNIEFGIKEPNKSAIKNWGAAMHNKNFKGMQSSDFDVDTEVELMQIQGMYLEEKL